MITGIETVPYATLEPAERIIVALDCDARQAYALANTLQGQARWLKIGMTLFYREGPAFVAALKERGYKVFVDLKLYDIPHQVRGAAMSIVQSGADMFSIHASGGRAMMEAARTGAFTALQHHVDVAFPEAAHACAHSALEGLTPQVPAPIILGVTVLTSMEATTLESVGVVPDTQAQVKRLALLAHEAGLSGVVASPMEAQMLRELLGPEAAIVTPGVRPAGASLDDQARVASPVAAFQAGASHLVIGRPITESADPAQALRSIILEIERGLS